MELRRYIPVPFAFVMAIFLAGCSQVRESPSLQTPSEAHQRENLPPVISGKPSATDLKESSPPPANTLRSTTELAMEALVSRELDKAAALLEQSVRESPQEEELLYKLALVHEERGDLSKALHFCSRLRRAARTESWRRLAMIQERGLARKLGLRHIRKAELLAEFERYEESLAALQRVLWVPLPPALDHFARDRYYTFIARKFAARVQEEVGQPGGVSLALAQFVTAPNLHEWEGRAFAYTLAEELSATGIAVSSIDLPSATVGKLAAANTDHVPREWLAPLLSQKEGDEPRFLLVGGVDDQVRIRLLSIPTGRVRLALSAPYQGVVNEPPNASIWAQLPQRTPADAESAVEIWTPKHIYTQGDRLDVKAYLSQEAYLLVLSVSPDGKLRQLFPKPERPSEVLRPAEEHSLSAHDAFCPVSLSTPGVWGLKAIMTGEPISLPPPEKESDEQPYGAFCKKLMEELQNLPDGAWVVADWTFHVVSGETSERESPPSEHLP